MVKAVELTIEQKLNGLGFEAKETYTISEVDEILIALLNSADDTHKEILVRELSAISKAVVKTTCDHMYEKAEHHKKRADDAITAVTRRVATCKYSVEHLRGQSYAYGDMMAITEGMNSIKIGDE